MITCYTCGFTDDPKYLQAGHGIPGRTGSVLFDLDIIKPQCPRCNVFMRGQLHIFAAKLIKERGLEWWEQKIIASRQVRKWSRDELQALIEKYRT